VGALGEGGGICGVGTGPVASGILGGDGVVRDDEVEGRPVAAAAREEDRTSPRTANPSTATKRTIAA
jgi:hypothetical protein